MAPRRLQGNVSKVTARRRLPLKGKRRGSDRGGSKKQDDWVARGGNGRRNGREGQTPSVRDGMMPLRDTEATATSPLLNRTVSTICREPHSPSTVTTDGSYVENNSLRQTQLSITQFVAETIFPHLKFLDGNLFTLNYSAHPTSICNLVLTRCFRTTTMSQEWWEKQGKKYVRAAMSRLRSDRMQGIKQAFMGR